CLIFKKIGYTEEINMNKPSIALTIAGTDPTGGAGVMADVKSFHARGVYGVAAITSIVAQITKVVQHIHNIETQGLNVRLDIIYNDELPQVLKAGVIASKEMIEVIQRYLKKYSDIPEESDPVMLDKSGDSLMDDDAKSNLQNILLPQA